MFYPTLSTGPTFTPGAPSAPGAWPVPVGVAGPGGRAGPLGLPDPSGHHDLRALPDLREPPSVPSVPRVPRVTYALDRWGGWPDGWPDGGPLRADDGPLLLRFPRPLHPLGTTTRAGLADFAGFLRHLRVARGLAEAVRLPVQVRRTGFTPAQKSLALLATLAAGAQSARDGDFVLGPDPVAPAVLGLPRWPHSSQLTRHLRAFHPQHVQALRAAVEDLIASHSTVRWRLRRGEWVVVDVDQTAISANGRTYERAAAGHLKKKGDRGYQASAAFAGDTSGGDDEVLAVFLDPGNTHASARLPAVLAALERVLGPLARLPGLVLRFDRAYATADNLELLLRRRVAFITRIFTDRTAALWAAEQRTSLTWVEVAPNKWVADLGEGPIAATPQHQREHPDLVCRRILVRSVNKGHGTSYSALLTTFSAAELPLREVDPFYEGRQTIEGWLSEATAALQLKGLWSRHFEGLEAFLLHAMLASNLLNWWARRQVLVGSGLPVLGLRQLIGRVIALPARVFGTADGDLVLLVPPGHPYARHLIPDCPAWQLRLPLGDGPADGDGAADGGALAAAAAHAPPPPV